MTDPPPPAARLSPAEVRGRLARGEPLLLLDVREPFERALATIDPGSAGDLAIPLGEVAGRVEEIRRRAGDRLLVVYCHHGVRSGMAADWLSGRGIAGVANLEGGIDAWSRAVDPTVPRYG